MDFMDFRLAPVIAILVPMSLLSILLFLVIILVLVIVHEFGHFIVAKWTNMRVDEFAFGFPPRLYAKKKGETTYAINALPLGGYVSIWGENGEPDDIAKNHPRAFGNRPWWAQLLVLVAGVTMNMLLAWLIFVGISYGNIKVSASDEIYGSRIKNPVLTVMDASADSPAYKAGITPGTTLISVTTKNAKADLKNADSLINFISAHNNDSFTITYQTETGIKADTTIAAVYGIVPDKKAIGISVDNVGTINTTLVEAVKIGSTRTYEMTKMTFGGLTTLFSSIFQGKNVIKELSGPIGIARIVGQTSEYGYKAILTLVAVLSINLAIFNILPLPALDGGRMVVVIIEAVSRRKVPHKYYSWVNVVGFLALMLLLVLVTLHDVRG
ncbi:TPA: hypothetical protein DEP94_00510 [Candidatus Nomurabacteria bacterium]|nr:hypothetical protein [Candidatus Nomurabacteria bacterium]